MTQTTSITATTMLIAITTPAARVHTPTIITTGATTSPMYTRYATEAGNRALTTKPTSPCRSFLP